MGLALAAAAPQVGQPAPPFSVMDTQGRPVSIGSLKGKVVVLEWSNPGCPVVRRHYQGAMQALQRQAVAQGVVWITVNSTNAAHPDHVGGAALEKAYSEWKASNSHLVSDPDGSLGRLYEAKTTPHIFVVNGLGVVTYMGAVDDDPRGSKTAPASYVLPALAAAREGRLPQVTSTQAYGCSVKY
jgi:hypothetical protein